MSRALNLNAPPEHVTEMCAKHKAGITQIEKLVSGGTRVVLKDAESAVVIGRAYKGKILGEREKRAPTRLAHN